MTAAKHKRRRGNPAKPSGPRYRPGDLAPQPSIRSVRDRRCYRTHLARRFPRSLCRDLDSRSAALLSAALVPAGRRHQAQRVVRLDLDLGGDHSRRSRAVGRAAGLADGWKPRYKKLFGLGTVLSLLTICVPPLTSADVLMYAAYGRLQAIGRDPYEITPAEVFRGQFDPVLSLDRAAVAGHPQRLRPDHVLDAARSPTSSAARTCTTSCSGCRCSRSCPSSSPAPAS